MSDLHKEIEQAMDADEDKAPAPAEVSPEDENKPDATEGDGEETVAPEAETPKDDGDIPDELVERAVKAGISLADTRTFTDPKVLERTIALVEKSAPRKEETNADDGDKGGGDEISADNLPAELSADEYDEGLVKSFNGMRSLLIEQGKLIAKFAKEWYSSKAEREAEAAAKAKEDAE